MGHVYYDSGSTFPYDDAYANCKTNLTSGLRGYAAVKLVDLEGKTKYVNTGLQTNKEVAETGPVCIEGFDYAKSVAFSGKRAEKNSNYWTGFIYTI